MILERDGRFGVRVHAGKRMGFDPPRISWLGTYSTREEAERVEANALAELKAAHQKRMTTLLRRKSTIARGGSTDHWVYHCFDRDGSLLYIGITSTGTRRFRIHGNSKVWWPKVATIRIEHHLTAGLARAAEKALIAELQPPHNSNDRGAGVRKRLSPDANQILDWEQVA